MKHKIPFLIALLFLAFGVIFEPDTPCRQSIGFWGFSISMLFALLNLRFDWLGDWKP